MSGPGRRWGSLGFLVAALVAVGALALGVAAAIGLAQNRATRALRTERELGPAGAAGSPAGPGRGRIVLDVVVAQVTLVPSEAGTPVRLQASYDPDDYELLQELTGDPATSWTLRVGLRPRGSPTWALFRAKLGGPLPTLRLGVPRDVRLDLEGSVDRGFAALELGGTSIESARLDVGSAAALLSFSEPLREPMERLEVHGGAGSLQINGLGNASPSTTVLEQRFGALSLDLRGPWARDARIRIDTRAAGGSLWLPGGATVVGLEDARRSLPPLAQPESEVPRPRLTITGRAKHLLVVE